jgi:BolA protein
MASDRPAMIRERLNRELQPVALEIIDESAQHAGHAGAASGGGHFVVTIVSTAFENKTPMQRHRLVYAALDDIMHSEIHALSIRAKTPEES